MSQSNKANGFVIVQQASSYLIYITGLLFMVYLNFIVVDVCWEHGFLRAFYTVPRLMGLKAVEGGSQIQFEPNVYCVNSFNVPCFLHQSAKVQDIFVDSLSGLNHVVSFLVKDVNDDICLLAMHSFMVLVEFFLSPFLEKVKKCDEFT